MKRLLLTVVLLFSAIYIFADSEIEICNNFALYPANVTVDTYSIPLLNGSYSRRTGTVEVDFEKYIVGVVIREIYPANDNAYRAQAIAAMNVYNEKKDSTGKVVGTTQVQAYANFEDGKRKPTPCLDN